jgi:hypothetical protein
MRRRGVFISRVRLGEAERRDGFQGPHRSPRIARGADVSQPGRVVRDSWRDSRASQPAIPTLGPRHRRRRTTGDALAAFASP